MAIVKSTIPSDESHSKKENPLPVPHATVRNRCNPGKNVSA
ncbi:MAG: hypothetical protein WC164_05130 [Patescibacteria group bacterium]